ncbi:MAG: exonuclease SbcCD subunit D [Thermodesulfobacterium sp.]|nr:exonuclease SbcCD subunit D [Thermodesulfobacterium sp.]
MRLIHTSDWHLGKVFFGKKILEEQRIFFENNFFPLLREVKPDLLVVTGDLVDKPIPDYETLKTLEEILYQLFELKIPTYIILGNHDSKRVSLYKEFLKFFNFVIEDGLTCFFNPLEFVSSQNEKLYFYLFPYLSPFELKELAESFYKDTFKNFISSKIQIFLQDLIFFLFSNLTLKKPAILLGHFAVERGLFSGEELFLKGLGGEELFPLSLLKDFDLVLLGHLHRLQRVNPHIYYSGSIMPYSFEESQYKKGVWLIEIKEGKLLKTEAITLNSPLKLKVLKGSFKELLSHPQELAYTKIILKDCTPVYNPFERLKANFPNLLVLEYENSLESSSLSTENSFWLEGNFQEKERMELNEETLFINFYRTVEGKEVDLKILNLFKEYVSNFKEKREGGE